MFVCIFRCLRDIFDTGFQQQSKGKGSVGSRTTRSVSLCQVLLEIRRVHNMYSFRILVVRYCNTMHSVFLIEFSKHSIFLFLFASRLLAKKGP